MVIRLIVSTLGRRSVGLYMANLTRIFPVFEFIVISIQNVLKAVLENQTLPITRIYLEYYLGLYSDLSRK